MSLMKEHAAPGRHQYFDGPPRQASRCGEHYKPAPSFVQPSGENNLNIMSKGSNMSKTVSIHSSATPAITPCPSITQSFTDKQVEILKTSICKDLSNDEFEVFLMACLKTQLDPFMRQIYAVKRKSKKADGTWQESMTIQTGIDGYRLIAERTEKYAPGPEPTYVLDGNGNPLAATAYIKKMTKDGTWHTISASAHIEEYMQTFTDRNTGKKRPTGMWGNMPKTMLSKCAEAQALRRAFPAEMSGVYTKEEMQQADIENTTSEEINIQVTDKISYEQFCDLSMILTECSKGYQDWFYDYLNSQYSIKNISQLPLEMFEKTRMALVKAMEQNHARQQLEAQTQLISTEAE